MAHAPGRKGEKLYGINAQLQAKIAAKFDPKRVAQACAWIEAVTGKKVKDFHGDLKSGVVLCTLMNKIKKGSVKKIKKSAAPFVQRENLVAYLTACKKLGMKETDVFVSQDLFEGDNLNNVVNNIFSLSKLVKKKVKSFSGPYIDDFSDASGKSTAPGPIDLLDNNNMPVNKGKAQPRLVTHGTTLEEELKERGDGPPPVPDRPTTLTDRPSKPPSRKPPTAPKPPKIQQKDLDDEKTITVTKKQAKRIPKALMSSGLVTTTAPKKKPKKKVVKKKRKGGKKPGKDLKKMSQKEQQELCKWWIEEVTGRKFKSKDFHESLKDGVLLCYLVNAIKSKTIKKFKKKGTEKPFTARENIKAYVDAVRKLGVGENDLFLTNDLYEAQAMKQVVNCIMALSAVARKKELFDGPFIGAKISESGAVSEKKKGKWLNGLHVMTATQAGVLEKSKEMREVDKKYVELDGVNKNTEHLAKIQNKTGKFT